MDFLKDEIHSATDVVRNFSTMLGKVKSGNPKKIFIMKNNKFEAVLLNLEEYKKMQEAVLLLETIYKQKK